jgi:hypothetical protein
MQDSQGFFEELFTVQQNLFTAEAQCSQRFRRGEGFAEKEESGRPSSLRNLCCPLRLCGEFDSINRALILALPESLFSNKG